MEVYPYTSGFLYHFYFYKFQIPFFYKNVTTGMKVSQARGVILLTLKQAGVKIIEITPLQMKQAMTGYGRAEKEQVQKMVAMELKIKKKIKPDDAADALALAIVGSSFLRVGT